MKEITQQWLKSAKDDIKIIEKILDDATLTHQAAFHAQQAIEKTFKAVLEEMELPVIKTHVLSVLYNKINKHINISVDNNKFTLLDDLYIDARYPGDLGLLPNGKPTIEEANDFYTFANFIHNKIINYLNSGKN